MNMRDIFLPHWLLRWLYNNPDLFRLGFFVGLCSLAVITYKLKRTQGGELQRRWIWTLYTGMFWAGINTVLFHPYHTHMLTMLFAIPMLVSHVWLAAYMISKYGIGGDGR